MKHKLTALALSFVLCLGVGLFFSACDEERVEEYTEGLRFTELYGEDGTTVIGYSVGAGDAANEKKIVIPPSYQDLPVLSVGLDEPSMRALIDSLSDLSLEEQIPELQKCAFSYCPNLTEVVIPDSVTLIGYMAFADCNKLQSVTIGSDVTSIEGYAFEWCTGLTSIEIPDSVTSIGGGAFFICQKLTNITIGNGVTEIGDYAFLGCMSLTEITIPDSVASIGGGAFESCTELTEITIGSSVTSIGDSAFEDCTELTNITIGSGVTSIGNYAFMSCTGLTSIEIPDSVTSIGYQAFYGCRGLTSIEIPDSVTSIGNRAFFNTAYYNTDSNWSQGVLYIGKYLIEAKGYISGSYSIINGTKLIGVSAFSGCEKLTSIDIPDSVTSIGGSAFSGCTRLKEFTIGSGVTSIEISAFRDCTSLTTIYFNGSTYQWKKIEKGSRWRNNSSITQVVCNNGTLTGDDIG